MMKLYRVRSSWMDDERLHVPSMTVLEKEDGWHKSGLLDQHGNELMYREESRTIGFLTEYLGKD